VKLLTQPGDGVNPLVNAINSAATTVDIAIFRFDRKEVERALINAVNRGVQVRALIACTNRGGEKRLRDLETRLLGAGVMVARTADDLVRYHAKYVIIDRSELFLLAFNFTYLDIEQSRSFGIITRNKAVVEEISRLFEMDMKRQPYTAGLDWLVVSPTNARAALAKFIKGAKKELYIYDPNISDPEMMRALEERRKNGVEVRVLGRFSRHSDQIESAKLHNMRLHTRLILRDGSHAFIGSQSLRRVELDRRRALGTRLGKAIPSASRARHDARLDAALECASAQRRHRIRQGQRRVDSWKVQIIRPGRTHRAIRCAVPHAERAARGDGRPDAISSLTQRIRARRRSHVGSGGRAAPHVQRLLRRR